METYRTHRAVVCLLAVLRAPHKRSLCATSVVVAAGVATSDLPELDWRANIRDMLPPVAVAWRVKRDMVLWRVRPAPELGWRTMPAGLTSV